MHYWFVWYFKLIYYKYDTNIELPGINKCLLQLTFAYGTLIMENFVNFKLKNWIMFKMFQFFTLVISAVYYLVKYDKPNNVTVIFWCNFNLCFSNISITCVAFCSKNLPWIEILSSRVQMDLNFVQFSWWPANVPFQVCTQCYIHPQIGEVGSHWY